MQISPAASRMVLYPRWRNAIVVLDDVRKSFIGVDQVELDVFALHVPINGERGRMEEISPPSLNDHHEFTRSDGAVVAFFGVFYVNTHERPHCECTRFGCRLVMVDDHVASGTI